MKLQYLSAAIRADGYKSMQALTRGPNGGWNARALRSLVQVIVNVDAGGNVSAN